MLADSLKNIFAVSDLRKRVLFTLGLLAVYRVGGHIPTPGVNKEALELMAEQAKNTLMTICTTPPAWAAGLPLAAEAKISRRYGK